MAGPGISLGNAQYSQNWSGKFPARKGFWGFLKGLSKLPSGPGEALKRPDVSGTPATPWRFLEVLGGEARGPERCENHGDP